MSEFLEKVNAELLVTLCLELKQELTAAKGDLDAANQHVEILRQQLAAVTAASAPLSCLAKSGNSTPNQLNSAPPPEAQELMELIDDIADTTVRAMFRANAEAVIEQLTAVTDERDKSKTALKYAVDHLKDTDGYVPVAELEPTIELLKNVGWRPCGCPSHWKYHQGCPVGKEIERLEKLKESNVSP